MDWNDEDWQFSSVNFDQILDERKVVEDREQNVNANDPAGHDNVSELTSISISHVA